MARPSFFTGRIVFDGDMQVTGKQELKKGGENVLLSRNYGEDRAQHA